MDTFVQLSEHIGCALLLFDEGMRIAHANARAAEILNLPPGSLSGLPLSTIDSLFLDPHGKDLLAEERPLHQTVLRKKNLRSGEFLLSRKGGSRLRISLNASPLLHSDGKIRGVVADFSGCCPREERLHRLIGAMDEIVFEFDADGRYLNVWTENEELLKVPGSQLLGRRFEEFVPSDISEKLFDIFRRVKATGKPETFEYSLEVMGGRRWFLARIALVPSEKGVEPTFSFMARDITAQKELEHRLQASERRFRGLFENAAAGIGLIGLDGRCLASNQCVRDQLGYSEEELRQNHFSVYTHPEDLPADQKLFAQVACGDVESIRKENRYIRKNGQIIWGQVTAALQRDNDGTPLYIIAIMEDITRRKRVEAEKEQLLGELKAIFESAGDGIVFYDVEGNIVRLNDAAKEILGYSDDMIKARLADRYQHWAPQRPDGRIIPFEKSKLHLVFQGESTKNTMAQFRRSDGQQIWITFSATPIRDGSGRQIGAVSTMTDITALKELKDRLEDYIHMLGHDLRSPLTVISGYAEILREAAPSQEERDCTEAILSAVDQMLAMMEDLVEVGRLESGQTTLYQDTLHLGKCTHSFLKGQISDDYRRVHVNIPGDLPPVRLGKHHLERILENLIGNALKYSDPSHPVEVEGFQGDGQVCLAVRDHGPGISPEDLPRIFDRFYRTPSARSRARGSGIGLYITRKLIESYGGSIRVESRAGEGTTFTFNIPKAATERFFSPAPPQDPPTDPPHPRSRQRSAAAIRSGRPSS